MSLLKDKNIDVELEIDQNFLTLSQGKVNPPGGFNYRETFNSKPARDLRKAFKLVTGVDANYDEDRAFKIAMTGWQGDPLSDVAVLKLRREGGNVHEKMDRFVNEGLSAIDNPSEELSKIWEQVSTLPKWVNWDRIEHGAKIYRRFGIEGHRYQGIGSLDMYRVPAIARTLMSTGQYADDTAYKRYLLTCNFWTETSEPNGMKVFNAGWKVALKVRLLHTIIRRAVFGSERWESEKFGMPINQSGMLIAPLISSVMLCKSMQILGYKILDDEIEDVLHLWKYISYILGYTEDNHFPTTVNDAVQTMYQSLILNPPSIDEDSIRLGQSFLNSFKPKQDLPLKERFKHIIEYKTSIAFSAFFVSSDTRKLIGSPNPWGWAVLYTLVNFPKNRIQDLMRLKNPTYAQKLDHQIRVKRRNWLENQLNDADLNYRPQSKY